MFKALESVPLFKGLDEHTLHLLEPLFEPYSCPAGAIIFEQGDPAHYMYLDPGWHSRNALQTLRRPAAHHHPPGAG